MTKRTHKTYKELEALQKLDNTWCKEGRDPPNQIAIDNARKILDFALSLNWPPSKIRASIEEGVVMFYLLIGESHYGMIICFNDGQISAGIDSTTIEPEAWEVNTEKQGLIATFIRLKKIFRIKSPD